MLNISMLQSGVTRHPVKTAAAFRIDGERGATHIVALFLVLTSIYSTYLLIKQGVEAGQLAEHVVTQQKKIEMLELKLQVLSLKAHEQ